MNCHWPMLKLRPVFTFGVELLGTSTADHGLPTMQNVVQTLWS